MQRGEIVAANYLLRPLRKVNLVRLLQYRLRGTQTLGLNVGFQIENMFLN